jgi:hypothetical protein
MLSTIALAALALRAGLALRRRRHAGARRPAALYARHFRFAKPAVALALIGFALGPLSMWWLRGRAPLETAHSLAGIVTVGLFAAAGLIGRRLERGSSRAVELHARLALAAVLAALAAAIMGFVLLP